MRVKCRESYREHLATMFRRESNSWSAASLRVLCDQRAGENSSEYETFAYTCEWTSADSERKDMAAVDQLFVNSWEWTEGVHCLSCYVFMICFCRRTAQIKKQKSECTYKVTLRRFRESLLSWKINTYYIFVCVRACVRNACVCIPGRFDVSMCMRACSVAYPACNAYTPCCDVICSPSGSTMCSALFHKRHDFREKVANIKCVFWFSLQLLFETFLILRRIQRDIVINVKTYSCKVPVIITGFNEIWTFSTKFRKNPKY